MTRREIGSSSATRIFISVYDCGMFNATTWWLLGLLIAAPCALAANDSPDERASLKGLGAISLVVEDTGAAAQKYGLTAMRLQNEIQERLQRSGISVRQDADPYLYVQVTVVDPGGALPLAYSIQVSLVQEVALPRGLNAHFQGPTWWQRSIGMSGGDRVSQSVSGRAQEFVDQFINAYRSVNPKP
jgi:hypothetical protein